jgi:hypothetical protein
MSSDAVIEGVAGSLGAVTALVVTYPLLTVRPPQVCSSACSNTPFFRCCGAAAPHSLYMRGRTLRQPCTPRFAHRVWVSAQAARLTACPLQINTQQAAGKEAESENGKPLSFLGRIQQVRVARAKMCTNWPA